jgi:carboxypeptidase T
MTLVRVLRRLRRAADALLVIALLVGASGYAPAPPSVSEPPVSVPRFASAARATPPAPSLLLAYIYFANSADRDQLAARFDAVESATTGGYVTALITPADQAALLAQGYRVEIDAARTALLNAQPTLTPQAAGIAGYPCYRTVEETYAALAGLAAAYPSLAHWLDIGDSWEKLTPGGAPGYDLNVLVITNAAVPGPKPAFFLMAAIHAREYVTAELATRYAEYLVTRYGVDPDVTWLLDHFEVHVLPQANPDGRKIAEAATTRLQRKNTNPSGATDCSTASYSQYGVDLNRNANWHWDTVGTSHSPCAETYPGLAAASEPETAALQAYLTALYPDARGPGMADAAPADAAGLLITLHSYGQLVLFPWGDTAETPANFIGLQTLGRKFGYFNHYQVCQPSLCLYATSGTTDDWLYGELGTAAYTFELGTQFFQSCNDFENTILPANLPALLYALKATRRPYQAPAGPDTLTVTAPISAAVAGVPLTLTATANDARYDSNGHGSEATQAIAAARYSIDAPAWVTGTVTHPLAAADGAFDAPVEALTGALDTTGLALGRHLVLVESQDAAGNWGVPSAVFIEILPAPPFTVTPAPSFAFGAPGAVVTHTLWLTNTSALTVSYGLSVTGDAWPVAFSPTLGPVAPGAAVPVVVTATIAVSAALGDLDEAALIFASVPPAALPVTVTLVTAVPAGYGLYVWPPAAAQGGALGTTVTYALALTSLGDLADTFNVALTGTAWATTAPATVGPLALGQSAEVLVSVHVPYGLPEGATDTATVTFTSQGEPARSVVITLTTRAHWPLTYLSLIHR